MPTRRSPRHSPSAGRPEPPPVAREGVARVASTVLLDGNVLVALLLDTHVHHAAAAQWFAGSAAAFGFATCPITQGTLLRLLMQLERLPAEQACAALAGVTAHERHRFWPDVLPYSAIDWRGVLGHRQVTDAYLAALARQHRGRLATFDRGLAALHADVALLLDA